MNVGHKIIIIKVKIVEVLPTVFIPEEVIPIEVVYACRGCVYLQSWCMSEEVV